MKIIIRYEFLNAEEMASALHVADVVISRAGLRRSDGNIRCR